MGMVKTTAINLQNDAVLFLSPAAEGVLCSEPDGQEQSGFPKLVADG